MTVKISTCSRRSRCLLQDPGGLEARCTMNSWVRSELVFWAQLLQQKPHMDSYFSPGLWHTVCISELHLYFLSVIFSCNKFQSLCLYMVEFAAEEIPDHPQLSQHFPVMVGCFSTWALGFTLGLRWSLPWAVVAVCYWQMRWAWERQRRRPSTSAGGPSDSTNLMDNIIYIYIL